MGNGFETEYLPIPENVEKYKALYKQYVEYGSAIENEIMKSKTVANEFPFLNFSK